MRINRTNAKILEKLSDVKPKILTAAEWMKHCERIDNMSVYMHAYKKGSS